MALLRAQCVREATDQASLGYDNIINTASEQQQCREKTATAIQ